MLHFCFMQSGTQNCPYAQMDNPLSGYESMSETIQAYMCMTFTAAIMAQNTLRESNGTFHALDTNK